MKNYTLDDFHMLYFFTFLGTLIKLKRNIPC